MKLSRRGFFGLLTALPFVGRLKSLVGIPSAKPEPLDVAELIDQYLRPAMTAIAEQIDRDLLATYRLPSQSLHLFDDSPFGQMLSIDTSWEITATYRIPSAESLKRRRQN